MGFKPTTDSLWVRCVISQFCFSSTINIIATTSNQDSHEDVHFHPTCPYFQLHCSMGGGGEELLLLFISSTLQHLPSWKLHTVTNWSIFWFVSENANIFRETWNQDSRTYLYIYIYHDSRRRRCDTMLFLSQKLLNLTNELEHNITYSFNNLQIFFFKKDHSVFTKVVNKGRPLMRWMFNTDILAIDS